MDAQVFMVVIALLLGAAAGAVVCWLMLKTKAGAAMAAEHATLRERLAGKESDLQRLPENLQREGAEHKQTRNENVRLQAELEGERRAAAERIGSFNRAAEELAEKFKALSRDALRDNNQS